MRSDIAAAFEESTRVAPDPGEVMAGIHAGIKRRRIRGARARITAVVMVVVGVGILGLRITQKEPVANSPIQVGEWYTSIELPFVPQGLTLQWHDRTNVAESILWLSEDQSKILQVRVDNVDRERNLNLLGWEPTTLNSRPARAYFRPGVAHFVWQLLSGRWAEFDLRLAGESQAGMQTQMITMLNQLVEKQGMQLSIGFAPTYLPAGHRVIGVGMDRPFKFGFGTITTATGSLAPGEPDVFPLEGDLTGQRRRPDLGRGLTIAVHGNYYDPSPDRVRKLADIGGRPAYYYTGGNHELVVRGFHGGVLVITNVSSLPADSDPVGELIKVAEGVRWLS